MINKPGQFVALVLAADRTADDPVAGQAGTLCKAIVPVCGTPMVIRVLDALELSGMVSSILLCGPSATAISQCPPLQERIDSGRVRWIPNMNSPSSSAEYGLTLIEQGVPVLLTTADHALLTPEIVRHFLLETSSKSCDASVGLVEYNAINRAYPGVRRTVTSLRNGKYCGSNLYVFSTQAGHRIVSLWKTVEQNRKRPWKQLSRLLGPYTALSCLFGKMTLEQVLLRVSAKTGITIAPVIIPYPEAGIDVDTPADLLLAETILSARKPVEH